MRALAFLPLTACLAVPDGKAQAWPPPEVDIVGARAADLDDDGVDDLVVLSAGEADRGAGLYLLRGGVDLDPDVDGMATTFTTYAALHVGRPTDFRLADLDGDSHREVLVLADDGQDLFVAAFNGKLALLATAQVGTSSVSDDLRVTLATVPYPSGPQVMVLAADTARRAPTAGFLDGEPDFVDVDPLGLPEELSDANVAATYHDNGMDEWALVLAAPSSIQKVGLEAGGMPLGQWSSIRSGGQWPQQLAIPVGTGFIKIVGVDTQLPARQVCAHDVYTEQPVPCSPVGMPFPTDHRALDSVEFLLGPEPDLAILDIDGRPIIIPNLAIATNGDPITHDPPIIWQGDPFDGWAFAVGQFSAALDHQLVVAGPHGDLSCLHLVTTPSVALATCTP